MICKDDGLRVCCINAQSCRNKTLAIADHIIEQNFDVMAICETWLKSKRDTNVIKDMLPNGYSIEHTPRPTGKGGGVAIIYRSSLQFSQKNHRYVSVIRTCCVSTEDIRVNGARSCCVSPAAISEKWPDNCNVLRRMGPFHRQSDVNIWTSDCHGRPKLSRRRRLQC